RHGSDRECRACGEHYPGHAGERHRLLLRLGTARIGEPGTLGERPQSPMTLPKRDWMEMTWADIAAAGEAVRRWIAVLPLAAVEQHGPHLPLGVDAYIAEAYLARVRKILPEALPVTFL